MLLAERFGTFLVDRHTASRAGIRFSKAMSKKSKKASKSLGKAVRKAVRRHGLAAGVLTGAATAVALSSTGATKKMSEAVGTGVAGLLKAGGRQAEVFRGIKKATGDVLVRAGRSLQSGSKSGSKVSTTNAKATTRRSAASRASS